MAEPRPRASGPRPAGRISKPAALALCLTLAPGACGPDSAPRGLAPPDLFQWSQERFDRGDHGSAARGFQEFQIRDPLNPLTDSAQFMVAESYLRDGKRLDAAEEFRRLATGRPNSPWADDAQYGACRAYFAASPKIGLTQEFTRMSIDECTRLLQFFPQSPLAAAADSVLQMAQAKMAEKSYSIGKHYYDDKFYESANVYFEKALSQSPSPVLLPRLLEILCRSYTRVGFASEASIVRERLLTEFPDSDEARRIAGDGDARGCR